MSSVAVWGTVSRGLRNPFRGTTRAVAVVLLLAFVIGLLALMVQATTASRVQGRRPGFWPTNPPGTWTPRAVR